MRLEAPSFFEKYSLFSGESFEVVILIPGLKIFQEGIIHGFPGNFVK